MRCATSQIALGHVFVALFALIGFVPSASAQQVVHRVGFGETYASIAQHYYGQKAHAAILAWVNGATAEKATSKISPGRRIRVPTAWFYTVQQRTSLARLAKRFLGDVRRVSTLLAFNARLKRTVRVGQRVRIPFVVRHQVQPGERLTDLAQRYYGNRHKARLIARHNFWERQAPPAGTVLEIPIGHIQLTASRQEELFNARVLSVGGGPLAAEREALQEANAMIRRGAYWGVPLRLLRLVTEFPVLGSELAEVYKLLAIAYVATGHQGLAVAAFREALLRYPDLQLDPITVSPKVIKAFLEAK